MSVRGVGLIDFYAMDDPMVVDFTAILLLVRRRRAFQRATVKRSPSPPSVPCGRCEAGAFSWARIPNGTMGSKRSLHVTFRRNQHPGLKKILRDAPCYSVQVMMSLHFMQTMRFVGKISSN